MVQVSHKDSNIAQATYGDIRAEGAQAFKARLLRAVDDIECSQLGEEEGSEYVLGPDFRPPSEQNIEALRKWIESFKI